MARARGRNGRLSPVRHALLVVQATQDVGGPRPQVRLGLYAIGDEHLRHVVAPAPWPAAPTTGPLTARRQEGRPPRHRGVPSPDDEASVPASAALEPRLLPGAHGRLPTRANPPGAAGPHGQRPAAHPASARRLGDATPPAPHRYGHLPSAARPPARAPAPRVPDPRQRQRRRHERGPRGGSRARPPTRGAGQAPIGGGAWRGRATRQALGAPRGLLIPHVPRRQRPPQGPPPRPAGELRSRALERRHGPLLTAQRRMDAGPHRRRARSGRLQPCGPDRVHHRRIPLALAPPQGATVFATRPTIFHRLAGRWPVRAAPHRRARLPRDSGLPGLIPQPPSPDQRSMAMAGGIRQPRGGNVGGPDPKARAGHLHAGPSRVLRCVR